MSQKVKPLDFWKFMIYKDCVIFWKLTRYSYHLLFVSLYQGFMVAIMGDNMAVNLSIFSTLISILVDFKQCHNFLKCSNFILNVFGNIPNFLILDLKYFAALEQSLGNHIFFLLSFNFTWLLVRITTSIISQIFLSLSKTGVSQNHKVIYISSISKVNFSLYPWSLFLWLPLRYVHHSHWISNMN